MIKVHKTFLPGSADRVRVFVELDASDLAEEVPSDDAVYAVLRVYMAAVAKMRRCVELFDAVEASAIESPAEAVESA